MRTDGDDSRNLKTPLQMRVSKRRDESTGCAVDVDWNRVTGLGLVLFVAPCWVRHGSLRHTKEAQKQTSSSNLAISSTFS
jgi:hypothetical protein